MPSAFLSLLRPVSRPVGRAPSRVGVFLVGSGRLDNAWPPGQFCCDSRGLAAATCSWVMAGGATAPNRTRDGCRQTAGDFFRLRRSTQFAVVITAAHFLAPTRGGAGNCPTLLATLAITFVGLPPSWSFCSAEALPSAVLRSHAARDRCHEKGGTSPHKTCLPMRCSLSTIWTVSLAGVGMLSSRPSARTLPLSQSTSSRLPRSRS